jgi:hypothetical protein
MEIIRFRIDITASFAENTNANTEIPGGNHGQEGAVGAHDGHCVCSRFGK